MNLAHLKQLFKVLNLIKILKSFWIYINLKENYTLLLHFNLLIAGVELKEDKHEILEITELLYPYKNLICSKKFAIKLGII